MTDEELVEMYYKVKRDAIESSLSEAIMLHAQACGFVSWVANVHPDTVAKAVKEKMYEIIRFEDETV